MANNFKTIDDIEVTDKRVLIRTDLNVPIQGGRISDPTRIQRVTQTIFELLDRGAKVIIMSHFGRPKGKYDPDFSLASIADALSVHTGREVKFAVDCVGKEAEEAVEKLHEGEMLLLENLRFHEGETENDPEFSKQLAKLGDIYVNDAFSCSHRSHASVVGVAKLLPSVAGRLMEEELSNLERILAEPEQPIAAIIGGSKVSTKLSLLKTLIDKVDFMFIGGGMANTFLKAQGYEIGKSICEHDLLDTAREIIAEAKAKNTEIMLPSDGVVTQEFAENADSVISSTKDLGDGMMLDIGPKSVMEASIKLQEMKTIVWNGPMGAFEIAPFDTGTIGLARTVASLTADGKVQSIAGGGDTVAALGKAGLTHSFSYLSTAGGAFLEWLEGKELPGVAALNK